MVRSTIIFVSGNLLEVGRPGREDQPSILLIVANARMAKSSRGKFRTHGNRRVVMDSKVVISTPSRLDTMSMALHTNNERKDAHGYCVARRVKRNREVHGIADADTVTKL